MIPKNHAHDWWIIMLMKLWNHEHEFQTSCAWNFVGYFFLLIISSAGRNFAFSKAALIPLPARKRRLSFLILSGVTSFSPRQASEVKVNENDPNSPNCTVWPSSNRRSITFSSWYTAISASLGFSVVSSDTSFATLVFVHLSHALEDCIPLSRAFRVARVDPLHFVVE